MDTALDLIQTIQENAETILQYLKFLGILIVGFLLVSSFCRFIFGKKAQLNRAVSSAVEIFGLYCINIVLVAFGIHWELFLSPLPFMELKGEHAIVFPILQADFSDTCTHILRMLMVAFFVNILNDFIPRGKKVLSWYFFRLLTVVLAVGANYVVDLLLNTVLPANLMQYAPMVLLMALIALILLGSLKLITGVALSFMNPVVGALYTFFFSNFIGRHLARAMVTTAMLTGLVVTLNSLGFVIISIAPDALFAYLPLLAVVLVLWYIVAHIL